MFRCTALRGFYMTTSMALSSQKATPPAGWSDSGENTGVVTPAAEKEAAATEAAANDAEKEGDASASSTEPKKEGEKGGEKQVKKKTGPRRQLGRALQWYSDRGYGFIVPVNSGKQSSRLATNPRATKHFVLNTDIKFKPGAQKGLNLGELVEFTAQGRYDGKKNAVLVTGPKGKSLDGLPVPLFTESRMGKKPPHWAADEREGLGFSDEF